jgi:GNAT superfamily N-acetyltransferase
MLAMQDDVTIERLKAPVADADMKALAELHVDAVDSGAAVSFLAPLAMADAIAWWRDALASVDRAIVLVARRNGRIVGTVQAQPAWAPNQPHRAEVCKMIVHRDARGAGLGERLLRDVEAQALAAGRWLLTLDAKQGAPAIGLYKKAGWQEVGAIPDFALDPDGKAMHATVVFYKRLRR